tara:strand:- start:284 stop:454 length:171 start_codon:yes stop_codon:yes gene_type:complete
MSKETKKKSKVESEIDNINEAMTGMHNEFERIEGILRTLELKFKTMQVRLGLQDDE